MPRTIEPTFIMFSPSHLIAVLMIILIVVELAIFKGLIAKINRRCFERSFALSLLLVEWLYYLWMYKTGKWTVSYSLPLELCSISLYASILLLWTGNKRLYPFVLFAGIGGALQAIVTPDLEVGFPHFRYFQFFYVHGGIIFTAFYFTWIKNNRPTLRDVFETMIVLNLFACLVFIINIIVSGNYMFLREKPKMGSLLDYLGSYPYYIISLEGIALLTFMTLWLLFKDKKMPIN